MKENIWNKYSNNEILELNTLCDDYREFISDCKTERECVSRTIEIIENKGFRNIDGFIEKGECLKTGDKVYVNNMKKALALFVIGEEEITKGINILGAHIDSPRLDLKANPFYEDTEMAYFDTHYYGGIKKYQWVTIPLALHGVVVKKDGSVIDVVIGEDVNDPVVGVTDLLPHLASEQMKKNASNFVEGEKLDVLIGSRPLKNDEEEDLVKKNILKILNEKYEIEEDDFLSAEIEVVPAGRARDFVLIGQ